jgi:ATP-binding cassette, subfamily B, bacterial MsbA
MSSLNERLIWRLLNENFRKYAGHYAIAILAMLVVAAMTSASAWIMADITNGMMVTRDADQVKLVAVGVAVIFTVKGIASFFQSLYLSKAGNGIVADLQRKIYTKLLGQGLGFYNAIPSSDLQIRVTNNAQAARAVIDTVVVTFVRDLFSLIGLIAVMVIQQPILSLVSLIFGPLAIIGVRNLRKRVKKIMELELVSLGQIVEIMQETSIGIRIIKAFSLEPVMHARMVEAVGGVEKRANSISRLEAATGPIMETLSGLAIAGVVAVSSILVLQEGHSPGEMMSFITALLLAYEPAKRLARMRISIESGMVGVRMMFDVLDHDIVLAESATAIDLPAGPGHVRFEAVSFAYRLDEPVLKSVHLDFEPGKMTALVGPSGSGKSTIINMVMRLYDPVSGSVSIDGHDLRDLTFASLRARMSYVGQDTFLFSGTIRSNIALGRTDATDNEIVAAARSANAHDFIMKLEKGYDTQVGENGGNLSGGQKQRLAIARAMLRSSDILILDEATSALDSESEALVRDALQRLTQGRTTIVIAHRLSTIANADRIIVLENGEVVEQGKQSELLAQDGLYKRLYEYQFAVAE